MLDKITEIELTNLFTLKKIENLPYEIPDKNWVSVTFEMDLNLMLVERKVYTVFDCLSDVGGLLGILVSCFSIFSSIWNY